MKYIVLGPGRSGSHWICDLLSRIVDLPLINDDITQWSLRDSVLHTHDVHRLVDMVFPEHILVIVSYRKNAFDATVSFEVAKNTDEWYYYSDKPVEPFRVDPESFMIQVQRHQEFQNFIIKSLEEHSIPYVICVHEDLLASTDRYEYIANLIGYPQPVEADKKDVQENRNKRDYKKIIINYDELKNLWESMENA